MWHGSSGGGACGPEQAPNRAWWGVDSISHEMVFPPLSTLWILTYCDAATPTFPSFGVPLAVVLGICSPENSCPTGWLFSSPLACPLGWFLSSIRAATFLEPWSFLDLPLTVDSGDLFNLGHSPSLFI
jgi:hypothetical protein